MRLDASSTIDLTENKAAEMVMRPKSLKIRDLYGSLKYDGQPLTIEQMGEAIGEAAAEHFKRSQS